MIFHQLFIVFCTCAQISSTCSVPHSLFNASHVETLPCCSVQCSVRIHLLYKFAWIFSKLTDPVWWLLNKSTPWLAMDLSCYPISRIKEELSFEHDGVHMHLSISLNDDVLFFVLKFFVHIFSCTGQFSVVTWFNIWRRYIADLSHAT